MRNLEIKRILVPTDLSPNSTVSLRYAWLIASHFSSALTLLYVDPITFPVNGPGMDIPLYFASTSRHWKRKFGPMPTLPCRVFSTT